MLALLVVLTLGIALGLLRGGSFEHLRTARMARMPLIFAAFALQAIGQILPEQLATLAFVLVLLSFVLIFAWAASNVRAAGMAFIAIGAAMNFAVIAANQGMPISAEAAARSGYTGDLNHLVIRGKHVLDIDGDARLRILSDWIPLGGNPSAASIGDLVLWSGLALLLQDLIAGPRGRRSARDDEPPEEMFGRGQVRAAVEDESHVRIRRGPYPQSDA